MHTQLFDCPYDWSLFYGAQSRALTFIQCGSIGKTSFDSTVFAAGCNLFSSVYVLRVFLPSLGQAVFQVTPPTVYFNSMMEPSTYDARYVPYLALLPIGRHALMTSPPFAARGWIGNPVLKNGNELITSNSNAAQELLSPID